MEVVNFTGFTVHSIEFFFFFIKHINISLIVEIFFELIVFQKVCLLIKDKSKVKQRVYIFYLIFFIKIN